MLLLTAISLFLLKLKSPVLISQPFMSSVAIIEQIPAQSLTNPVHPGEKNDANPG